MLEITLEHNIQSTRDGSVAGEYRSQIWLTIRDDWRELYN